MSEAFFFDSFIPATAFILMFVVPVVWLVVKEVKFYVRKGRRYE